MEKNEQIIAAIDIGTTKIASVVATKNENKFCIEGFGSVRSNGIQHGVVQNIDDTVKSITNSLNQLGKTCNANFSEVYVGIAGQYVKTKDSMCRVRVKGVVTAEHLDELKDMALNYVSPGYDTIEAIVKSYAIDGKIIDKPLGQSCEYLFGNFHLISGQTMMVNNIKKCVSLAGLSVKSLFLEPLASADAVVNDSEKQKGVVLVDIGGGTTDIAIFKDGEVVHTAVIPLGGASITNDIAEKFNVNYEQAEKLKCMYGSAVHISGADVNIEIRTAKANSNYVSRNEMSDIIQSRMEEILNAVKFQIENIYDANVPNGIVITGGGSLIANLNQLACFILKNNIRIVAPSTNIEGANAEPLRKPQFSTLVGLLVKGDKYDCGLYEKQLIAEQAEQERLRIEAEKAEQERLRIEAEKAEQERLRIEAEKAEQERLRIEAEKAEQERLRIEAEKAEQERLRIEAEKAEQERLRIEAEKAEQERLRIEAEKAEQERLRIEAEKAEQERLRIEAEKAKRENNNPFKKAILGWKKFVEEE